jgi:uncharacterized protein (UPF0335 family)
MAFRKQKSARERLVYHVQELERLEELKSNAADDLKARFDAAKADGFDTATLRVVLKLRKMTPNQRKERRALEAIYMAALGMLDDEPLPDDARRRLDGQPSEPEPSTKKNGEDNADGDAPSPTASKPRPPEAPTLPLKTPDEAREEGAAAGAAGKRIYDNPYPAGDPCRAAWDEGWCRQSKSHGMDTPAAFQRRTEKPPGKDDNEERSAEEKRDAKKGAA